MSELGLDAIRIIAILKEVAAELKSHTEELRLLDAKVGDGDLGVTVELSTKAMDEYLTTTSEADIGKLLAQCGMNINRVSPSTFGTILASAFMGAGKAVMGKPHLGVDDLVLIGEGAIENIQKRGRAEVGDKTVLDALVPAVEALKHELTSGADAQTAINIAVKAAEDGMNATVNMKAKFGRAKWFQDGGIGVQDGGATAMYYMVTLFSQRLFP